MQELYIKILSNYSDEDLDVTYHLIQIKKESDKKILSEFYYKTEYLINYNKIKASKILSDIKKDIEIYLEKPQIEDMSLDTISMYDEYLSSSESVVYVEFETKEERDKVFNKLENDLPKEIHNTFEQYGEDSRPEILLYSDFVMLFNLKNLDRALKKLSEINIIDEEELEL